MMYSEFIELTQVSENYISYAEYTMFIEPIYMDCKLPNKQEFCKMWKDMYRQFVFPAVEKTIRNMALSEKEAYVFENSREVAVAIEAKDFEARKIMYQYLELMANI